MFSRSLRLLVVFAMAAIACPLVAQETAPSTEEATDAELTYFDLRRSKDHATKQFADRYFSLVKPQEWTSLNGKSKINAKYVAHDPNLAWVKLATIRGTGATRTTREVTVEVAKLNKTCQSRVKQISVLQAKLDELVVEEKKREEESENESRGGYGDAGGRGEEMAGERGGRNDEYGESEAAVPTSTESERDSYGAASEAAVPDGSDDPDPLGFSDLASELAAAPAVENPGLSAGGPPATPSAAGSGPAGADRDSGSIDQTQWRTNYAAFRANVTTSQGAGGALIVDWGELADLRQMNETAETTLRDRSDPYRSGISEIADRIGEVQWAGAFAGLGELVEGKQEVKFNLPPISPPLKLRFFVYESEASSWSALRPGEQVRFAGRFDIRQPLEIELIIRKLD
jgi:hypothetical protein